jgi:RNA polymerase sigma-70 factor (ECF subfamily)
MRGQAERANESAGSWAVAEEWRALYARARFLAQDHDLAQDLVQETLLRAIAAAPRWEDAGQRRAWLLAVLRNLFIDRCRSRAVIARAEREALCLMPGPETNDERADVLDVLSARDVEDACRGLCERDRELLERVYFQRRPHKEVAAATGVKAATVATRLFRAKGRLRQALQDLFDSRVAAMDAAGERGDRHRSL